MEKSPGPALRRALLRYRVMAYVVGVGLVLLVVVGMPLQYGAGRPTVVEVLGPVHGLLYIVYLLTAFDLARRARLTPLQVVAMVGAGLVPLVAFVVERAITTRVEARLAPD